MPPNNLSLLLLLARVGPPREVIEKSRKLITAGIDWDAFFSLAVTHGVAPLVYQNLGFFDDLPERAVGLFHKAYLYNIADTVRSSRQLCEVSEALRREGIESVPIKGVTTADQILGGPWLYPSSDIDLLVRRNDIGPAIETFRKQGYATACEINPFYIDHYEDIHLFKPGLKSVEIHSRLGQKRYFSIPGDYWWDGLMEWDLDGHIYRVLSVEKNFFFLSLHLFGHGYSPLKFIVTIAEMLKGHGKVIDWQGLFEYAESVNALKPLLLSCYLAGSLLDAPVPGYVEGRLQRLSPGGKWIFGRIRENVFREHASFSEIMFLLTVLQYDMPEVLRRMIGWLFPPLKEVAYRYNLPLRSLKVYGYYLLNPFLLLFKKRNL